MKATQVVLSCFFVALANAAHADVPLVYSRCPRAGAPFELSGEVVKGGVTSTATITLPAADLVEALPDTTWQRSGFVAPCDLVYRDEAGAERVLYDCISTSTPDDACAALDAAVSYDAKTIAFAVFRGPLEHYWASVRPRELDPAARRHLPPDDDDDVVNSR